ncbi:lipopolysaccharide-induced tumor necrosis factor-alpha factor homolog isoform X2 [Halyomorpha halys]|uniref:lipopolysaccharide-induced tumor necrosis factor-alpha factor homolog isoform X2 n=1 Tax=Halyomorpha halys TaxID=286706 RepID=UPI0006D4D7B6|nr:lipopolysaccharide-induced tumor necrosis factor-alpha factor homolog isoform X2 [Halyomorpha halys]
MESKFRPSDHFDIANVAPLPSAPPPSYDDAMGTSNSFGGAPLLGAPMTSGYVPPQAAVPSQPVQTVQPPYPVQQVQIAPVSAAFPNRLPVGRRPLKTTCTGCNTYINTKTTSKNNCNPTFWCIVLFVTGLVCFSCCPYFCCNEPYQVDHFCPKCNAYLGTYHNPT